jgi:hypothetical protein
MATRRKKTDKVALQLRMREHLRARLAVEAKHREVSLNAEIVQRLEESLEKDERNVLAKAMNQGFNLIAAKQDDLLKAMDTGFNRVASERVGR